jgi:hypothetical protein
LTRASGAPGDIWYAFERPDEDRLEDAVLADRRRELVERRLLEDETRLLRVRFDRRVQDPDADLRVGCRGEADDRRRKLVPPRAAGVAAARKPSWRHHPAGLVVRAASLFPRRS